MRADLALIFYQLTATWAEHDFAWLMIMASAAVPDGPKAIGRWQDRQNSRSTGRPGCALRHSGPAGEIRQAVSRLKALVAEKQIASMRPHPGRPLRGKGNYRRRAGL
jgi:hypothetical protein